MIKYPSVPCPRCGNIMQPCKGQDSSGQTCNPPHWICDNCGIEVERKGE